MASALLGALESDDVYISGGRGNTGDGVLNLGEKRGKSGSRKSRSQADAALGLQERGSVCCGTGGCMGRATSGRRGFVFVFSG